MTGSGYARSAAWRPRFRARAGSAGIVTARAALCVCATTASGATAEVRPVTFACAALLTTAAQRGRSIRHGLTQLPHARSDNQT
jgi:hypothetical protein